MARENAVLPGVKDGQVDLAGFEDDDEPEEADDD